MLKGESNPNILEDLRKQHARKHNESAIQSNCPVLKLALWTKALVLDKDPVYYYQRAEALTSMNDFDGATRNFKEFERVCQSKYVMRRYAHTSFVFGLCLLDQFRYIEVPLRNQGP
jgi:hypothetical protein